ncbi:MAG: HAD family phosphatase [Microthrixaceae bacterium]
MTTSLPDAVLWDLDGTLVDTEPHWIAAEHALVEEFGGSWTDDDSRALVGSSMPHAAAVLRSHGVALDAPSVVERLVDAVLASLGTGVTWQPGARELLAAVRDSGIPSALVTMSPRRLLDTVVASAPPGSFTVTVAGDEVERGKPDPLPYLRGAELLGVDPRRCVAFEDSPTGLASAEASGATTVAIVHLVPIAAAPRRSRVRNLDGFGLEDLAAVASGEVLDRVETIP